MERNHKVTVLGLQHHDQSRFQQRGHRVEWRASRASALLIAFQPVASSSALHDSHRAFHWMPTGWRGARRGHPSPHRSPAVPGRRRRRPPLGPGLQHELFDIKARAQMGLEGRIERPHLVITPMKARRRPDMRVEDVMSQAHAGHWHFRCRLQVLRCPPVHKLLQCACPRRSLRGSAQQRKHHTWCRARRGQLRQLFSQRATRHAATFCAIRSNVHKLPLPFRKLDARPTKVKVS